MSKIVPLVSVSDGRLPESLMHHADYSSLAAAGSDWQVSLSNPDPAVSQVRLLWIRPGRSPPQHSPTQLQY